MRIHLPLFRFRSLFRRLFGLSETPVGDASTTPAAPPAPAEAQRPGPRSDSRADRPLTTPPRRPQQAATIVIGLDFGTHSTKILLRRRGDPNAVLYCPDSPCHGFSPLVTPSLIRVDENRV